eukprot:CAMPEP_0195115064 /NCGR_PEP_ID=MMETSP0448-20130528/107861_1 /TAXON_ID=66468 /ORGANISM="Heterocapsa triquestra, Strain CCMP 448" /LENGTH=46 /DNA_ID= /DNA_START= /DNA_END= /DNA_ORIENTATION=
MEVDEASRMLEAARDEASRRLEEVRALLANEQATTEQVRGLVQRAQ